MKTAFFQKLRKGLAPSEEVVIRAQIPRAAPFGAPAAPSGDPGVPVQHWGLG